MIKSNKSKHNKQSLQKFTDLEEIKTTEDFIELQKTDSKKLDELFSFLKDKINEAIKKEPPGPSEIDKYFNRLERLLPILNHNKTTEDKEERLANIKRERWYLNDALIKQYIDSMLTKNNVLPTNTDIHKATGLSRVTVDKHLKESSSSNYRTEELEKFKLLNNLAISRLYKIGMTFNNTKALKMFIDYTGEPKKTIINNNYLQINNTRIDSLLIDQLPPETKNQIEALILKNTLNLAYEIK
jgi:hypothetical protein